MGTYLNRLGKLTIYHSFILSNFNYCPVIWHFCSEANTKKMEKIQERALKFIYNENHSTYEELLAKSKLPSLKIRRIRTIAIEVKTTRYGLNSFRYYASKTWNELPDHFRKETSFNQFKSLINSWNGSSCHCSFCA